MAGIFMFFLLVKLNTIAVQQMKVLTDNSGIKKPETQG
jgi:hypothetical protein